MNTRSLIKPKAYSAACNHFLNIRAAKRAYKAILVTTLITSINSQVNAAVFHDIAQSRSYNISSDTLLQSPPLGKKAQTPRGCKGELVFSSDRESFRKPNRLYYKNLNYPNSSASEIAASYHNIAKEPPGHIVGNTLHILLYPMNFLLNKTNLKFLRRPQMASCLLPATNSFLHKLHIQSGLPMTR